MTVAILNADQTVVANRYIYNHDITNDTASGIVASHLDSGRALCLTEPWDKIQLHESLRPLWNDITAHYERIGLSFTRDVKWYLNLKELGAHIGYQPSVFCYGPNECQYWGDYSWLNIVEYIKSRNNFMELANELNIDVPKTICLESADRFDTVNRNEITYPCYVKAAVPVSGHGIYRCENEAELQTNIKKFDKNVPVQIQEQILAETFLILQYQVIGTKAVRLAASEKLPGEFAQHAIRFPASYEPWNKVDLMAHWLVAHGMKGIFSFDVAVQQTNKGLRFLAIECIPSYNDASYPVVIAKKLNIPQWTTITFSTRHSTLEQIDLCDIEYDKQTGEGAVIINWGTVIEGKLTILLAGSDEYREVLALELLVRL